MKLFAVYSKVDLIEKPEWFDAFYKKLNPSSTRYHVTLKQSCYVQEEDIPIVKAKLADLFKSTSIPTHKIMLNFNDLILDEETDGLKTIMLSAEYEPSIHKLQKDILAALSDYQDYLYKESQTWEERFKPHITLASGINRVEYEYAVKKLENNHTCKGVIRNVSLIIVEKMTPEEADKAKNQTIYRL